MIAHLPNRLSSLLSCHSHFSFGRGVSSPTMLVETAAALGYSHCAITDTLGVYAAVELVSAAQKQGVTPLIGACIPFTHKSASYPLYLLAGSRQGYETLNRLITLAKAGDKIVTLSMLEAHSMDLHCLTGGREGFLSRLLGKRQLSEATYLLSALKTAFQERLWVQLFFEHYPWDMRRAAALRRFAREHKVPAVYSPEVRYAQPQLMPLYDTLLCGRLGITLSTAHRDRPLNDCQAIPAQAAVPFQDAIDNANYLASQLGFELLPDRLIPPPATVAEGYDSDSYLEQLCRDELLKRYPGAVFTEAKDRLERELYILKSLGFADFFLVVKEVMDFCRARGILASGRGSAAGSVICYLLGISEADPVSHGLLFERFLHSGKRSMPDIDIDIASSRRREVFSWLEQRFPNSAMVCNKISYYLPSAIQDLGRGLGLPAKQRDTLTRSLGRDFRHLRPQRVGEAQEVFDEVLGEAPVKMVLRQLLQMMERGFVRQIAPHSGGWVLSRYPLSHYSPQEVSSGGLRCLQFDKDDIERLGLMKLDLLGLRMLGVFERAREEVLRSERIYLDLHPPDDPAVWQTIQAGDTMTLFQIESPAQVIMSVNLKPENQQDLKDQVALVRPGPIQSNSVHPYVRRRQGKEVISYLHPALEPILKRSYGVLLYQEQVMQIAHHVAGFDWEASDRFRKEVARFEDEAEIRSELRRFIEGARLTLGADEQTAMRIFELCASFRGYGFAESHAWAFGLHAYTSAWLRHYYPAEYLAGVMSEQPGMYSAGTLRQEARQREVGFARLDINASGFYYTVEKTAYGKRLRPPLCAAKGVSVEVAKQLMLERMLRGPYLSLRDLLERVALDQDVLEVLDRAGAFDRLVDRREGLFRLGVLARQSQPGQASLFDSVDTPPFPELSTMERLSWEFNLKGYSEHAVHPVDLYRNQLLELGAVPMEQIRHGGAVRTAGLVIARQKPPTAQGFAFWLLEDNQRRVQLVINPDLWREARTTLRDARILVSEGQLSQQQHAWTLQASKLWQIV